MTGIVNEYYGRRGVQFISWLAAGLMSMDSHLRSLRSTSPLPRGG
jgi:hypothetical protein